MVIEHIKKLFRPNGDLVIIHVKYTDNGPNHDTAIHQYWLDTDVYIQQAGTTKKVRAYGAATSEEIYEAKKACRETA